MTDFHGAIGEALRHFWTSRDEAAKERSTSEVDPRSPREAAVLSWFYQTKFWLTQQHEIELIPQFEIGKYLKRLNPFYEHPLYRVDFLLVYKPSPRTEKKIIIEYDGFREHFADRAGVTSENYETYYSEDDLYRQKVLESYGYRFVRINRFNVGKDPIATLSERLFQASTNAANARTADLLQSIQANVQNLATGGSKECPKCKEIRAAEDFRDSALASGVGRYCRFCKQTAKSAKTEHRPTSKPSVGALPCPKCGSKMILRTGRYGQFYGCSKYPYCRAIRKVTVA